MKKPLRLTSEMVAEVMVQGRAVKSGSFLFRYLEKGSTSKKGPSIAFISPKKSFPTAVLRNKVKRRGRGALNKILNDSGFKLTPDSIISAFVFNKEVLKTSSEELLHEIEQSLMKSGILVKP